MTILAKPEPLRFRWDGQKGWQAITEIAVPPAAIQKAIKDWVLPRRIDFMRSLPAGQPTQLEACKESITILRQALAARTQDELAQHVKQVLPLQDRKDTVLFRGTKGYEPKTTTIDLGSK